MVGHDAPRQHLDGMPLPGLCHQIHKGSVVAVSMEDLLASVTSVYDVVDQPIGKSTCYSRHVIPLNTDCSCITSPRIQPVCLINLH